MSILETLYHFKLDLQNVDQHTGGMYLIHSTRHARTIIGNAPAKYPCWESKYDIKAS